MTWISTAEESHKGGGRLGKSVASTSAVEIYAMSQPRLMFDATGGDGYGGALAD